MSGTECSETLHSSDHQFTDPRTQRMLRENIPRYYSATAILHWKLVSMTLWGLRLIRNLPSTRSKWNLTLRTHTILSVLQNPLSVTSVTLHLSQIILAVDFSPLFRKLNISYICKLLSCLIITPIFHLSLPSSYIQVFPFTHQMTSLTW